MHCTLLLFARISSSSPDGNPVCMFEETTMNPLRFAKNWISYRRTINELGGLSNQALNDIGLTRYDIRHVAARSFR